MAIPLAFLSQLGGLLRPGTTKATATSNVASTITAGITNVIGDAAIAPITGGAASASPTYAEQTSPYSTPSYLSGGLQDGSQGLGLGGLTDSASQNGIFNDPVVIVGGVLIVGAIAWALLGSK